MLPEKHSPGEEQIIKGVVSRHFESLSSDRGLNRQERRRTKKASGRVRKTELPQLAALIPEKQILIQEDDISFLRKEVTLYQSAQSHTSLELRAYNQLRQLGVTDAKCKKILVNPDLDSLNVAGDILREIRTKDKRLISNMASTLRMMYNPRNKAFYDPDETDLINSLIEDSSINGKDILTEVMRARQESIDLMKMQIDWLKERQELSSSEERENKKTDDTMEEELSSAILQNVPGGLPEASTDSKQATEEQFLLRGWRLFSTKSSWSSDPNHLTSIPTNSRQDTLGAVTTLTKGKASIKPNSILNALEFHLRKDVIQRALATKLKYGPDGIRDWVKIKRGDDRIFFLIPNPDETKAIFFVEGRDIVYRSV